MFSKSATVYLLLLHFENYLTGKKYQCQKTPAFEINYRSKLYSYFSRVKMVHPAQLASQGVYMMMNTANAITGEATETDRGKVLWVRKRRNSFPGRAGGIWAFCKAVAQRKEECAFFYFLDHMLLFCTGARLNGI